MAIYFMEIGVRFGLKSTDETSETQSVEDGSIDTAKSDETNEGEELQERNLTEEQKAIIFRIKEVLKSRTREVFPSLNACDKRIVQAETSTVNNVVQYITISNITDCTQELSKMAEVRYCRRNLGEEERERMYRSYGLNVKETIVNFLQK